MNIIKDLNDLPPNIFGFSPESLSLAEENTYLGKAIIELQNIRDNLGLKCILIPGFAFKSISIINIEQDENYQPITQSSTIHLPTQQESCETKDQLQIELERVENSIVQLNHEISIYQRYADQFPRLSNALHYSCMNHSQNNLELLECET